MACRLLTYIWPSGICCCAYARCTRGGTSCKPANRIPSCTPTSCLPADLPAPEPLSAADGKDAGPLSELLGEYLTCCAFSKAWQLREAALARVAADMESGSLLEKSSGGWRQSRQRGRRGQVLVQALAVRLPTAVAAA